MLHVASTLPSFSVSSLGFASTGEREQGLKRNKSCEFPSNSGFSSRDFLGLSLIVSVSLLLCKCGSYIHIFGIIKPVGDRGCSLAHEKVSLDKVSGVFSFRQLFSHPHQQAYYFGFYSQASCQSAAAYHQPSEKDNNFMKCLSDLLRRSF